MTRRAQTPSLLRWRWLVIAAVWPTQIQAFTPFATRQRQLSQPKSPLHMSASRQDPERAESGSSRKISIPRHKLPTEEDDRQHASATNGHQRQQPYRHYNSYNSDGNRNSNNSGRGNFRSRNSQQASFHRNGDRRQNQNQYQRSNRRQPFRRITKERLAYLETTTSKLLQAPPGFLLNGKHHELLSMFQAWHKHAKDVADAPKYMEKIMQRMAEERKVGNDAQGLVVDTAMYNQLLDAWACVAIFNPNLHLRIRNEGEPSAAQRARETLILMQSDYDDAPDSAPMPNEKSFETVLHAVNKVEGPTIARRVLAWMEYLHRSGNNAHAKPSRKQCTMILQAYRDGKLAHAFVRHMKAIGQEPDTFCYNVAIKAWTKTRRGRESAEHAEQILEEMDVPRDTFTYGTVISAWAASGMKSHAVSRAEKLLRAMEEVDGLEPNTVVLNTVMSTWVKSKSVGAVSRTEAMLQRIESSPNLEPDLVSYNTHLHALAMHSSFDPEYAPKAHKILLEMQKRSAAGTISFSPNLFSYNLVIEAWSKSEDPNAAFRAVETLRKLIHHESLEPDTFSFNCAISALSRSKSPSAARIAEELLQYMEDAYKYKLHRKVRPDVVSYTTTIVALSRSCDPDAPERAEALLERMKAQHSVGERYLKPNRMTYNSLISTWAKSGRGTLAARRAEAILKEMEEMCALGDESVSPNSVTFNLLINSWASSGTLCCGNKAESYLDRMWELYNNGDDDVKPDDLSFNTVINAIAKSQHKSKAQKALRVLRRMDKLYRDGYIEAKPCTVSYTTVIQSCAFPGSRYLDQRTRRKALDTAIFTFEELRTSGYGKPNRVTYCTLITACDNLLTADSDDDLRRAVIERTFQHCCADGLVDEGFLSHVRNAAPEDLYQRLLADVVAQSSADNSNQYGKAPLTLSVQDLPTEWRCNVKA